LVECGAGEVRSRKSGPAMSFGFPPERKHWHGASPTVAMTHIAIQEALDGKVGDWLEKVSDEQYNG
jgi:quercetin dioxygenase-like cupin family protein